MFFFQSPVVPVLTKILKVLQCLLQLQLIKKDTCRAVENTDDFNNTYLEVRGKLNAVVRPSTAQKKIPKLLRWSFSPTRTPKKRKAEAEKPEAREESEAPREDKLKQKHEYYSTSSDPHNDISRCIFGHIF